MKSTVLLIDDDPLDLKSLHMLLENWDLEVESARSGQEALDRLGSVAVDLVVSDVRMPGMSGEEVVRAMARTCPGLPVVLITGHGDIRSAVKAMQLGAFDYVVKPPDQDEFRITLERALEHSRLRRENQFLRAELSAGGMYGERLIGRSPGMQAVFDLINRVARTDSTVLIMGETGTGKELVAQTIHYKSNRADHPLIALNCAALNPNLIESEMFGHEKGAFTGALSARRGRFEEADGGTLFLDEIGETSLEFQAKLLRVLQEGEFERLGGNRKIKVDVRLLTSTNRDIKNAVKSGEFREDLFYRLSVIPVQLPPLRERREDIPLLAAHFVGVCGRTYNCPARKISEAGLKFLAGQQWEGNVRELQHAIERAVVLSRNDTLEPADFASSNAAEAGDRSETTLQAFLDRKTREYLVEMLDRTDWHRQRAADALGIDRATLYRMLKKHAIERDSDAGGS
jgi:DNA-binding NtrC family response regulator